MNNQEQITVEKTHKTYGNCIIKHSKGGMQDNIDCFTIVFEKKIGKVNNVFTILGDTGAWIRMSTPLVNSQYIAINRGEVNFDCDLTPRSVARFILEGKLYVEGIDNITDLFRTDALEDAVNVIYGNMVSLSEQYKNYLCIQEIAERNIRAILEAI